MTVSRPDPIRQQILRVGLDDPGDQPAGDPPALTAEALSWAVDNKLTGLLVAALTGGEVTATAAQRQSAAEAHTIAMARDVLLERALLRTVTTLRAVDIEPCVLKGSALGHLDFPDPSWRSFSDVDVLVRSSDYDRAANALSAAGLRRLFPEPRPGFDRRFSKGTVFVGSAGTEVDLHRTFAKGPYGLLLDLDLLWSDLTHFEVGGVQLTALAPAGRALHAAFQVALDGEYRRAGAGRDFAAVLRHPDLEANTLLTLADRSGACSVLARAVGMVEVELDLPTPLQVEHAIGRRDRRWFALYDDPRTSYAALSVAALAALPTVREKAAMAAALAAPRGAYVTDRHGSRRQRLRRNLGSMLRALRR